MSESVDAPATRTRANIGGWSPASTVPLVAGVACFALVMVAIGTRDLWSDEALTVTSTNQLWTSLQQRSGSMALYYLLMTPWTEVSLDPVWLRLPSAVLMSVAVALTCRLGMKRFGSRAGVFTAMAMVPMLGVTRWGQEARSYALVMVLAVGAWMLFFRLMERDSRGGWLAWGACGAALVYSHPLGGMTLAAQLLSTRAFPNDPNRATLRMVPGWATLAVLLVPMGLTFLQRTAAQPEWVPPLSRQAISDGLYILVGRNPLTQILIAAALVAAVAVLVASRKGSEHQRWERHAVACWLLFTPVVLLVISIGQPLFVERYLLVSLPAAALGLGIAIASIPNPRLQVVASLALVATMVPGQVALSNDRGDPWRDAADLIEEIADPTATHGATFERSVHRQAFEVNAVGHPVLDRLVPISPRDRWGANLRYYKQTPREEQARYTRELDVLWLVYQTGTTFDPPEPDQYADLGFCHEQTFELSPRIGVAQFTRCP